MKLNDIRPARGAVKKRKRIGCGTGSGHGKTATRGMKGQKSRSGGGMPPWFEGGQMPLQRRVPKRGFTNVFRTSYQIVNVERLNRFEKGTKIDRDALLEARLVRKASMPVKILGRGELNVALDVEVDAVSRSAAQAIRDAGGTVRLVGGAEPPARAEGSPARAEEPPAGGGESPASGEDHAAARHTDEKPSVPAGNASGEEFPAPGENAGDVKLPAPGEDAGDVKPPAPGEDAGDVNEEDRQG
jgi:large subunit ribosomal protein L15